MAGAAAVSLKITSAPRCSQREVRITAKVRHPSHKRRFRSPGENPANDFKDRKELKLLLTHADTKDYVIIANICVGR